jgi:2-keto-4-pentenoate hydratase/2-oxohepta-3-ene-1,7-dioic acid hydratase in catechol pathway
MPRWLRFSTPTHTGFGQLVDDLILEHQGDLFAGPQPTGKTFPLAGVTLLEPCQPGKFLGLWNNFAARALAEQVSRPAHPLYFVKANSCHAGPGHRIQPPSGYTGAVVYEGELGIVIGKTCAGISAAQAAGYIFGYTCVNDVTARAYMRLDPNFVHWTRAKSFPGFGVFGPWIDTEIAPAGLRVCVDINGETRQDYPVDDMFFSPAEIVAALSQDLTLHPGDLIACGTSLGAGPMQAGDQVCVRIDGLGSLCNPFGSAD